MKNTGAFIFGIILLILGVLLLLVNYNIIDMSWNYIWPIFILGPGLIFQIGYFTSDRKETGMLMPGAILCTYGILFYICVIFGFNWMGVLWPLFILGPGLGFLQMYLFGSKDQGLLIPAGILLVISLFFLTGNLSKINISGLIFPGILIIIGGIMVIRSAIRK